MCASHKLEMRKEAAQEMRSVMRKKLLITAAAIILSADFIAGGTMAIYRAAAHTDKTFNIDARAEFIQADNFTPVKDAYGNITGWGNADIK